VTEIKTDHEMGVTLVRKLADDVIPIQMAQASLGKDETWTIDPKIDPKRFLQALVDPRHGVPFEHDIWTFFVEVPIFVARQWVKHRHSSMNEMSGRYVTMLPKFYSSAPYRPLINRGTKMKPEMGRAGFETYLLTRQSDQMVAQYAWDEYERRLAMGVAEEYARIILPLNTYTQFYWSVNSRALMGFLERRVSSPDNRVPTHPQWEIDNAAQKVEAVFKEHMPITHQAFVDAGRVMP